MYLIMKWNIWYQHGNHLPVIGPSKTVGAGLLEFSGLRSKCHSENKGIAWMFSILLLAEWWSIHTEYSWSRREYLAPPCTKGIRYSEVVRVKTVLAGHNTIVRSDPIPICAVFSKENYEIWRDVVLTKLCSTAAVLFWKISKLWRSDFGDELNLSWEVQLHYKEM